MTLSMKQILRKHLEIPASQESNFAELINGYVVNKRYQPLLEIIGFGKGFNDKTKAAFCEFLNVAPRYSKHEITKLVLDYCNITHSEYDATTSYLRLRDKKDRMEKRLAEKYNDIERIKTIISEQIKLGRTEVKVINRARWMVKPCDHSIGFKLNKKDAADYASLRCDYYQACLEFMAFDKLKALHPNIEEEIKKHYEESQLH